MYVKQVEKTHYEFSRYMTLHRWASLWYQLNEVLALNPRRVLEIGPGPGLFKVSAERFGLNVETLDIDPELEPDHIASVFDMPFKDFEFDVVCAFQMLEHLPFDDSLVAFREMARVASRGIVISLPDAAKRWPITLLSLKLDSLPRLSIQKIRLSIPKPRFRAPKHQYDGQHYWEINKAGYPLKHVTTSFLESAPVSLHKTFRVHQCLTQRFFVFEPLQQRA